MASDSDDNDSDDAAPPQIDIQAHLRPLQKQLKKQSKQITKLEAACKALEKQSKADAEQREEMTAKLAEAQGAIHAARDRLTAVPWRPDLESLRADLSAASSRIAESVEEQRVQLAAHAQVFQSTQTSVVGQAHTIAGLQAEVSEAARRAEAERQVAATRVDHMRGELSERISHSLTEATAHADRLVGRVSQDLLRVETGVSAAATAKSLADATASLEAQLSTVSGSVDELRRATRAATSGLAEARDAQAALAPASALATLQASVSGRIDALTEQTSRVEQAQRAAEGEREGRGAQRQKLLEERQLRLERDCKHLEVAHGRLSEELSQRVLRTDLLSAVAQLELQTEACAPKEDLERIEGLANGAARADAMRAVEEGLGAVRELAGSLDAQLQELRLNAAEKIAVQALSRDTEGLRAKLDERLTRGEASALLEKKLDRSEGRQLAGAHESLQAATVRAEALAQRAHDEIAAAAAADGDTAGGLRALGGRFERLHQQMQHVDARIAARKAEVASVVKVLRSLLEEAEARAAIDAADPAAGGVGSPGSPSDFPGAPSPRRAIGGLNDGPVPPLRIKQISPHAMHKAALGSGSLQPLASPTASEKVWFKSSPVPRSELLATRRRLLTNARHSWVGDTCLAKGDESSAPSAPSSSEPTGGGAAGDYRGEPLREAGGSSGGRHDMEPLREGSRE